MRNVAILGASPKEHRYSYKAQHMLMERGYPVFPITPKHATVMDLPCYASLADCPEDVDTLTLYVGPNHLEPMIQDVIDLAPRLVIFNPGTESERAKTAFESAGIATLEACTLVLISTNQFERY